MTEGRGIGRGRMALPRRSVDRFLNQREHLPGATVEEVSPCRVVA